MVAGLPELLFEKFSSLLLFIMMHRKTCQPVNLSTSQLIFVILNTFLWNIEDLDDRDYN